MLKEDYYQAVQAKYPKATLARAVYKVDRDFTEKTKLDYLTYSKADLSKYLITVYYSDLYYFDVLGVNRDDTSLKVTLPGEAKQRKRRTLNLKQTLVYGGLSLHLMSGADNPYFFKEIVNEFFSKWRPYLWERVELSLD